jgi:hypothetical protein
MPRREEANPTVITTIMKLKASLVRRDRFLNCMGTCIGMGDGTTGKEAPGTGNRLHGYLHSDTGLQIETPQQRRAYAG